MNYYFNNTLNNISFDDAKEKVIEELKKEGFGVLSQIDMKSTLKNKLDVDFRPYVILGACNPPLAYKTLQAEAKIGLMLPCNVIVEENENGTIEVSAVNPVASMIAVKNDDLNEVATEVEQILKKVIENL
jgi:uncharacterized protein (DUF302 family)